MGWMGALRVARRQPQREGRSVSRFGCPVWDRPRNLKRSWVVVITLALHTMTEQLLERTALSEGPSAQGAAGEDGRVMQMLGIDVSRELQG